MLPEGRYLSCAFAVSPDAGGQTRALLLRNRILAGQGGVRPTLLTFNAAPDYPRRREVLLERGLLTEAIELVNIYDHYRELDWDDEPGERPLAGLRRVAEETRPDGTPWRVTYRGRGDEPDVFEYLREDGSPYIRVPDVGTADGGAWQAPIQKIGRDGSPLGSDQAIGGWFRRWVRDLAGDAERTFVFLDSRFLIPYVVPIKGRRIHVVYTMHNMHLQPPRRWDSPLGSVYARVLSRIDHMDAMVTLTERQRDDIALRRGRTRNMFVVPNPVLTPGPPAAPPERNPRLVTMLARLTPQKHLTDAIAAFARVVAALPDARLDIFGDGPERAALQEKIERRGLAGAVALRGYDPRAHEQLWRSSAFLLTSSFEGYPLSTLESMSHGCPVVSYDIKYGPREQITDGVDGFLVAPGDVDGLARRVVELLQSPELARRMGEAGGRTAQQRGPDAFLARWAAVLEGAIDRKRYRTALEDVAFELSRLRLVAPRRLARPRELTGGRVPPRAELELEGVLTFEYERTRAEPATARLRLEAIDDATGAIVELPAEITRSRSRFEIRAAVPVAQLPAGVGVWLRLLLTWQNSSWQTRIPGPPFEAAPSDGREEDAPPSPHADGSDRPA